MNGAKNNTHYSLFSAAANRDSSKNILIKAIYNLVKELIPKLNLPTIS